MLGVAFALKARCSLYPRVERPVLRAWWWCAQGVAAAYKKAFLETVSLGDI